MWPQIIYGDGGQSGLNAADNKLRFNSFFGQNHDANFNNGDPSDWVIISGTISSSPEGSYFYAPIIADPSPAAAGSIFEGSQCVWRTQDWGGDQAFLEANCPEFTTANATRAAVTSSASAGRRHRPDVGGRTEPTAAGAFVAAIERAPATPARCGRRPDSGRVFITDNANDARCGGRRGRVSTRRRRTIRRGSSRRSTSTRQPEPRLDLLLGLQHQHAGQPGHVFEVTRNRARLRRGSTSTYDLAGPAGDRPRARRPDRRSLRVTDFGVLKLASGGRLDAAAGGMPMVEVAGLTIIPARGSSTPRRTGSERLEVDLP